MSPRRVIVGYYEDGHNLVSMAMNDWAVAEPAWWLNLPGVVVLEPRGGRLSWSSPFPQVVRQLSDLGAVAS